MKNTQQIVTDLEWLQKTIADAMNEQFRPKYKNNTWLKQTDLHPNERICMQLIDELGGQFTVSDLAKMTGLSNKCIRDNFAKLDERGLIKRTGTGYNYIAVSIV